MGEVVAWSDMFKYLWALIPLLLIPLLRNSYTALMEKHEHMKDRVEKVEDKNDTLVHRVTVLETTKVSTEQMETKINERFRHLEDKIDKNNYQVENKIEKQNEKLDDIKSILIQSHDRRQQP